MSVKKNTHMHRVGGKMSHPINDEILENLFDKYYERISKAANNLSEEEISLLAEQAANAEFDNMVGPHG